MVSTIFAVVFALNLFISLQLGLFESFAMLFLKPNHLFFKRAVHKRRPNIIAKN